MAGRAGRALKRHTAFWDASALVPLCVGQAGTARAITLYHQYDAVVWWATPVEIASALARLLRMKHLDSGEWGRSRRLATDLADQWAVIRPSDGLRARAAQLVNRYDLSAADALQLAAALEWCGDLPQGKVFIAADQRLREAALLSGFAAERL
jgi:predicted nucleic acid-binding protein